jgi:hypothetical protein
MARLLTALTLLLLLGAAPASARDRDGVPDRDERP